MASYADLRPKILGSLFSVTLFPLPRFTTPHHKEGFELFLDTIVAMEEVWVVTAWQTVQWMRAPATTDTVHDFKPFQCDYKVTTAQGENICPMLKIYLC